MDFAPILSATSFTEMLARARDAISQSEVTTEAFGWFLPATRSSDYSIADNLPDEANLGIYNPGPLLGNFEAARALADRAIAQREELLSLEERAVEAFLSYGLDIGNQPLQLLLQKTALKATRAQADAGVTDATEETLNELDRRTTNARNLRLLLHKTPGHPLNYGERIAQLRTIHSDTLKRLLHRLFAVAVGLAHRDIAVMRKLPHWDGEKKNNLQALIEWLRDAVNTYEMASHTRVERILRVGIERQSLRTSPDSLAEEFAKNQDHILRFRIPSAQFPEIPDRAIVSDVSVEVGFAEDSAELGAAVSQAAASSSVLASYSANSAWQRLRRQEWSLSGQLVAPKQPNLFLLGSTWERPSLPLFGPAVSGADFHSSLVDSDAIVGVRLTGGEWTLRIDDRLFDSTGGFIELHKLRPQEISQKLWYVTDVIVTFKIQTWK